MEDEMTSPGTLDSLLQAYVRAAIVHREATAKGNYRAVNRAAETLQNVGGELRAHAAEGQKALLTLLEHEDGRVRGMAALDVLDFDPMRAISVLESLVLIGGDAGWHAKMALEYRVGRK